MIARLTGLFEEGICHEISLAEQVAELRNEIRVLKSGNINSLAH